MKLLLARTLDRFMNDLRSLYVIFANKMPNLRVFGLGSVDNNITV